ncbi:Oxysterol-binding protein 3 [Malassezia vespertilionis]|uniref:Oxysterol-binding protein 3 n=1 Tax=Malassezia vespertilionis TaxID=2020962 RepID=UPI0024B0A3C1|nr:Oxysterol-binding protein 3 [Malassezia vespertilionis]WFD07698.1 Oxysterol-binding protein 3 [Malassezia vespertilionis]
MNEPSKAKLLHSGWVLKKKKKKIQGYARRWLVLYKDGTLAYAAEPDRPFRGAIDVPHASVSSDKRHGTVHVDSGSNVFHLKMLNDADFETWRSKLRTFLHPWSAAEQSPMDFKSAMQCLERSDDLLRSSSDTLSGVQSMSPSPQIAGVITALKQIQGEHSVIHHTLQRQIRSGDSSVSRSGTPMSGLAFGGGTVSAAGLAVASASTPEDADFFDANDNGDFDFDYDGVEYQIEEDHGHGVRGAIEDEDEDDDDESDNEEDEIVNTAKNVTYRRELPSPIVGEEVSLFSMLKKNVGKDLSTISFPVSFNCPLSLLQAAAEEYEYAPELLELAAQADNGTDRILQVGAWAISGYASTAHRSSRKPFNPLLGETYECVRADRRLHFVAEKVVHRPPIVASYAFGKGWKVSASGTVKNKFWGKSLELIAEGTTVVELDTGDVYTISKPSSFMRNLLAGNKYLEHVGEMVITNVKTNERLAVQFKESSMFGGAASRNHITGIVYDANGTETATLKGKWDEQVAQQIDKDHLKVLWEAANMPPNPAVYYGFTYFAMSLNQITDDIKDAIPPTDSRLRPDQRAMEDGDIDAAESLKQTLEDRQRERRKAMEDAGETYRPQWFHLGPQEATAPEWVYGTMGESDYFQKRKNVIHNHAKWSVGNATIFELPKP